MNTKLLLCAAALVSLSACAETGTSGPRFASQPDSNVIPSQFHCEDLMYVQAFAEQRQHAACGAYTYSSLANYTIYFDYDKSSIRSDATKTLRQVAADIGKYNPSQVTVAGYTDTAGFDDYNSALSVRRANAVENALEKLGIESNVIDSKSYGENDLAVNTPDGVELQDNRRVVIDFVR